MPTVQGFDLTSFLAYQPQKPAIAVSFASAIDRDYNRKLYQQLPTAYQRYHTVAIIPADDIEQPDVDCQLFSTRNAQAIINLLQQYPTCNLVVHCNAGVSRTGAVVKFAHDYLHYSFARPQQFAPNRWILRQLIKTATINNIIN